MRKLLDSLRRLCAILVGTVFVLSGIFKLMDPVGASLAVGDYLSFFHLSFLAFSSKAAAVVFSLAEALVGAALVTGVWRRQSAIICWILTGFFTLLTLVFLIFNPDLECGCFGEVLHLNHLQTFLKNVVLLLLEAAAFIPLSGIGSPKPVKYVSFSLVAVSVSLFSIWSLLNIPVKDYTPFKPSVKLLAAVSESDFEFEEGDFSSLNEYPSLAVNTIEGESYDDILAYGKVMVVSIEKKMSEKEAGRMSSFLSDASSAGFMPVVLSADVSTGPQFVSDYRQLISLNRSNGGATYFNDGVLVRKWSSRKYPDLQELNELASRDASEVALEYETKGGLTLQAFLLYVFAILYLL